MELKHSKFRIILGIVVLFILYVGYSLITTENTLNGFIGVALIAGAIWGTLWLDHTFPHNQ